MKRSTDRILTSHVGTLPRPKNLQELLDGGEAKRDEYFAALPEAVKTIVKEQGEAGIDVINDGEFGKIGGFSNYVRTRLTGYELKPRPQLIGREQQDFPEYSVGRVSGRRPEGAPVQMAMVCTGPISYIGEAEIQRDIDNLKAALAGQPETEAFMAAVSPDNVNYQPGYNEYYPSEEAYVAANADALKTEYKAITDAGFVLQIDMPVMKYNALSLSLEQFRSRFDFLISTLNGALAGIPSDRIRVHICYGGMKIAHTGDLMLDQYIDILYKLNADGISIDGNVRHEHEWTYFKDHKLPDGKLIMPGVVAHTTDTIEHPELIAQRIERWASVIGRENVIAGTDCGLGNRVHNEIAWAKFRSQAEGCRIASQRLWS